MAAKLRPGGGLAGCSGAHAVPSHVQLSCIIHVLPDWHDVSPRTPLKSSNFPRVASYVMAAPIRGAGAVVDVQGVTVGQGTWRGEAVGVGLPPLGCVPAPH